MAMFDLEDCRDVNIDQCSTSSETLVKGHGVDNLDVTDCHAGVETRAVPAESRLRKVGMWILKNVEKIAIGALVIAIASYLGLS